MSPRYRDRLALDRLDIALDRAAQGEILQPEQQRRALGGNRLIDLVGQLDDEARPLAAHRAKLEVGEDGAQVALQLIDEPPLVAPLERNFVVSSYEVKHRDRLHPFPHVHHLICGERQLIRASSDT
jgi:hypothetical protein